MEAGLAHPVFDAIRPDLGRLKDFSLEELNRLSEERQLQTESGRPVRFVPPGVSDPYYEVHLYETGQVQTRQESKHDLFNALAWLSFPRTKARINAMHAVEIPKEGGKRGRVRDMLTIFDEGGAIVAGGAHIEALVRGARWAELFVEHASDFRIVVLGHAVLEQALLPRLGLTCKVVFAAPSQDLDMQAAARLPSLASPRELPPLPILGYPGWFPGAGDAAFYANERYFRQVKWPPGVGQAAAVLQKAEESPGSIERDAG